MITRSLRSTLFPYTTLFRSLGYQCVIYEALSEPGGLMRINIPSFRLPATVLDDEVNRSEEHTSELQSPVHLVCRLLLEKKKKNHIARVPPSTLLTRPQLLRI